MSHVARSNVLFATFADVAPRAVDSERSAIDEIADHPAAGHGALVGIAHSVESDAVQPPEAEPGPTYHPFGPAPIAGARVAALRPEHALPRPQVAKDASETAVSVPEPIAAVVRDAAAPEVLQLDRAVLSGPERSHQPEMVARRAAGAVQGLITNVYGRGLRDMRVDIVSSDKTVIASTRTIDGGRFIVDGLPPGAYFVRAQDDVDGDFEKSWYGGGKFESADSFSVGAGAPVDGIDIVLRSTAQIEVEATAGERKTEVVIMVTHRATGAPAEGVVELTTKNSDHISAELVDGQAYIAFTDGDMPPVRKVRVYYSGNHETRPATTKAKVH